MSDVRGACHGAISYLCSFPESFGREVTSQMFRSTFLQSAAVAVLLLVPALAGPKTVKVKAGAASCCVTQTRCCDKVEFCCDQPDKAECCLKGIACCDKQPCCGPAVSAKRAATKAPAVKKVAATKSCCKPTAKKG